MDEKSNLDGWPLSGSSRRSLQDWEKQCLDELDRECCVPDNYFEDQEISQSLWQGFESSAHAVAQLYKAADWHTFQRTASKVTQLYKDGVDAHRRGFESGLAVGRRKVTRDLVGLLKRCPRKYLYREELLGFLVGKDVPLRSSNMRASRHRLSGSPHHYAGSSNQPSTVDSDLSMFKDALTLPFQASLTELSSPSSRVAVRRSSWGRYNNNSHTGACHSPSNVGNGSPRATAEPVSPGLNRPPADLSDFFAEELSRHRNKRPHSSEHQDFVEHSPPPSQYHSQEDVSMDSPYSSPAHKRNRYV